MQFLMGETVPQTKLEQILCAISTSKSKLYEQFKSVIKIALGPSVIDQTMQTQEPPGRLKFTTTFEFLRQLFYFFMIFI